MTVQLIQGDCLEVLPTLPEKSVQCVVTSPPYWGLRDYGVDGQLGLEATPDLYVEHLVAVGRELWRVLRDDGTLWLNLGDSYAGGGRGGNTDAITGHGKDASIIDKSKRWGGGNVPAVGGLKRKDLVGIPWMVAFALRADGWYLRQDIVWAKANPMPESVTDRCTKSHEYLFLLTKSARYYFDNAAIKEPSTGQNGKAADFKRVTKDHLLPGQSAIQHRMDRKPVEDNGTRNRRDVWFIAKQGYSEAHFATFPEALVEPCILAGSKAGDVVLDPFSGSGTTGKVAVKHGRSFVGIDLKADYVAMSQTRIGAIPMPI
jgi:DNA modification methylase